MIWSVMPLGYEHELDLLEIKLATQDAMVDRFVVCEAVWNYSGDPKPLHVDPSDERWAPWRYKLIHAVAADHPPESFEPFQGFGERERWQRENWQRLTITRALELHGLAPTDVVVVSDLDEILKPRAIESYVGLGVPHIVRPELPMHRHYLNLHWRSRMGIAIARLCRGRHVLDDPLGVEGVRRSVELEEWRVPFWHAYHDPEYDLAHWGWHFSWMGGIDAIDQKLRLAAHPEELSAANATVYQREKMLERGLDIQGENRDLFWLPDTRLPEHAQHDRFAHLRCGPERASGVQANDTTVWRGHDASP